MITNNPKGRETRNLMRSPSVQQDLLEEWKYARQSRIWRCGAFAPLRESIPRFTERGCRIACRERTASEHNLMPLGTSCCVTRCPLGLACLDVVSCCIIVQIEHDGDHGGVVAQGRGRAPSSEVKMSSQSCGINDSVLRTKLLQVRLRGMVQDRAG